MSNVENVTGSKPKVTGAISVAPLGTTLPTDASTALAASFKSLGYVSEDGITVSESKDTSNVIAFGGDVVHITEGEHSYTVQFTLQEFLDDNVQKLRHGETNVTGTIAQGLKIQGNSKSVPAQVFVIDLLLDGAVERIVIPNGKITETGDIVYNNGDVLAIQLTVTGLPDASGNKYYEYIKKNSSTTG